MKGLRARPVVSHIPDFLRRSVASRNFMRLSLKKAHTSPFRELRTGNSGLAKNERDVGHPATGGGDRAKALKGPGVAVAPVEMCEES